MKKNKTYSLGLPEEFVSGSFKISVLDFCKLTALNYKSIIEYSDNVIMVSMLELKRKAKGNKRKKPFIQQISSTYWKCLCWVGVVNGKEIQR